MAVAKWIGIVLLSIVLLLVLLVALMDWHWVRDVAARQLSEMTGRTLTIEGDLDIDWSWTPHIRLEQVRLENATWSNHPYMLELAALDFRIDLGELITGRVVLPEITLAKPHVLLEKSSEGKFNWAFQADPVTEAVGETGGPEDRTEFPIIQRLRIEDGRVVYRDPSTNTSITAILATVQGQGGGDEAIALQAQGKLEGQPLDIRLSAGALGALRETEAPYPLTLTVQAGETTVKVDGTLIQPLQLKGLDVHLAVEGPNPKRLSPMLGFPLPSLPPYQLKGDLSRQGDTWQLLGFDGRVGDSDLTGDIRVDAGGERLWVKADLTSQKVDFDDLGPLIGLAPAAGSGETTSASQKQEAKQEKASASVLPQDPIDFKHLRRIDADITLRGKRVEAKLPLDDLTMQVTIDAGRLTLAPLEFGVATGSVRSRIELDARREPVKSKIETKVRRVRLNEILRRFDIADKSVGLIGGQATFWFEGDTIAKMLASADGGLLMLMTGGKLDHLLVELAGLDLGDTLITLIGKQKDVEINCAFLDLPTASGVMKLDTLVVDTTDTVFLGKGSIDFTKEQLDLVIDPKPKDLSLFSARAPLHIEGSFNDPAFSLGGSAIFRGAASLALLPTAPIASLISLLQGESDQESVYCSGLVEAINKAR